MHRLIQGMLAAVVITAMLVIPAMAAPAAQDAQAIITSPTDGQQVSGLVPIFGTATAIDFSRYEIAYGPDPNPGDSWITFATADIVLSNAQIGLWDANQAPGLYALRLRVFRSDGSVAAEDFVNGLIIGTPPTPTPEATPTGVPPAPTFGTEQAVPSIQPTVVIEQPPTSTATPQDVGSVGRNDDAASRSSARSGGLDLSRFGAACVNGIWCAVGAYFLLGAFVFGRWGFRWIMKQLRDRSNQ